MMFYCTFCRVLTVLWDVKLDRSTPLPTGNHHDDGSVVTIVQVKIVLF